MERLKFVTWNIHGLGAKETELNKKLKASKINMVVIIETNKKLNRTKELDDLSLIHIFFWGVKRDIVFV